MKAIGGYVLITLIAANANASEQQAVDRLTILPSEIIQEIDTQLFSPNTLFTRSAVSHHALYAVNKKMYKYKQQLPHKHLLQLANTSNIHRLLAHAYLLNKEDWIALCAQERIQAPNVRLKTLENMQLVDGQKTINLVDGTLAALILESYRAFLLDQSPRAHALHAYLEKEYVTIQKETPGTLYQDGTYLGTDLFRTRRLYQLDDCPFVCRSDRTSGYTGFVDVDGSHYLTACGNLQGSFLFKDMIQKGRYYILFTSKHIPESVLVVCSLAQNVLTSLDICLSTKPYDHHFPQEFQAQFINKKSLPFYTIYVFKGNADMLAYDDAAQELKVFDEHSTVLYTHKLEPVQRKTAFDPSDN